jgi:hypothetical protein
LNQQARITLGISGYSLAAPYSTSSRISIGQAGDIKASQGKEQGAVLAICVVQGKMRKTKTEFHSF